MTLSTLRIISRESPLAMWQAEHVRDRLCALHSGLKVDIIGITTQADKFLDRSLASMGGKGMFVKELEHALLENNADLAVHSMKDVTIDFPEALSLPIILEREDPRDVFVSNNFNSLDQLSAGARVGTSSLRRKCQLMSLRSDLQILDIRGNVGTRLSKLDEGEYDALILAAAGVKRLGLQERIRSYLTVIESLPAVGQGALGLEIRKDDTEVLSLLKPLDDGNTHTCVAAERALSKRVNGGCHAPIAAYATLDEDKLSMSALVGRLDGTKIIRVSSEGVAAEAKTIGDALGTQLLNKGAAEILAELDNDGGG